MMSTDEQCVEKHGNRQNAIFIPGAETNESPTELGISDVYTYSQDGSSSQLHLESLRKPICGCVFEGFASRLVLWPPTLHCNCVLCLLKPEAKNNLFFLSWFVSSVIAMKNY